MSQAPQPGRNRTKQRDRTVSSIALKRPAARHETRINQFLVQNRPHLADRGGDRRTTPRSDAADTRSARPVNFKETGGSSTPPRTATNFAHRVTAATPGTPAPLCRRLASARAMIPALF